MRKELLYSRMYLDFFPIRTVYNPLNIHVSRKVRGVALMILFREKIKKERVCMRERNAQLCAQ